MEVVLVPPMRDVLTDVRARDVSVPEVDTHVHPRVDDLLDRIREAREAPRRVGGVALVAERDLVRSEEVLQRLDEGAAETGVARGMLRVRRGVEQREPLRVRFGRGVFVRGCSTDRGDRS